MRNHFANKITFFTKPDGTTHLRFTYTANDAEEVDEHFTVVVPTELALNISKMIAKTVIESQKLTQKSPKKSNN